MLQLSEKLEASNRDKALLAEENTKLERSQGETRDRLETRLVEVTHLSSRRMTLSIGVLAGILSVISYFGYSFVTQNTENSSLLAERLAAQNAQLEMQLEDLRADSAVLQSRLIDLLEQIQTQPEQQ